MRRSRVQYYPGGKHYESDTSHHGVREQISGPQHFSRSYMKHKVGVLSILCVVDDGYDWDMRVVLLLLDAHVLYLSILSIVCDALEKAAIDPQSRPIYVSTWQRREA